MVKKLLLLFLLIPLASLAQNRKQNAENNAAHLTSEIASGDVALLEEPKTDQSNFETAVGTKPETLSDEGFNPITFRFFPNPVKDYLSISSDENINVVTIYDNLNKVVSVTEVDAERTKIDMRNLVKGTYVARITSGKWIEIRKFVKN